MGGVRESSVRVPRGGVSLHGVLGFWFGGKHLDPSESADLRGTAWEVGLRPVVVASGASSPVETASWRLGCSRGRTRRGARFGEPFARASRHTRAPLRKQLPRLGSRRLRRRQGRGEASRVSLPVVWVTSRHGNAKRPAFGRRRHPSRRTGLRPHSRRLGGSSFGSVRFAGEDEPYARCARAS